MGLIKSKKYVDIAGNKRPLDDTKETIRLQSNAGHVELERTRIRSKYTKIFEAGNLIQSSAIQEVRMTGVTIAIMHDVTFGSIQSKTIRKRPNLDVRKVIL